MIMLKSSRCKSVMAQCCVVMSQTVIWLWRALGKWLILPRGNMLIIQFLLWSLLCDMSCKGSWEVTTLSPWEYVNYAVSSLVVSKTRYSVTWVAKALGKWLHFPHKNVSMRQFLLWLLYSVKPLQQILTFPPIHLEMLQNQQIYTILS